MNLSALRKNLLALGLLALAIAAPARDFLVYFGTYTNALSQGIYVSRLDADTGRLSPPELAATTPSPCFLALTSDQKFLYAANSVTAFNGAKAGAVSSYAVDAASGKLSLLNEKSSGGVGPCHVSVDASAKVLLVANYGDGSVKTFSLSPDGHLDADGPVFQHLGSSVNATRQASAHAHFIAADPSNHFALACDLGMDRVVIYKLNVDTARLEVPFGVTTAAVPPGSGARHLAFSPDGRFAYVVNELACTVTAFAWDAKLGILTPRATVSALPAGVTAQPAFTAAEILMHPTGQFVYATVRGHDSVSVFARSAKNGKLKLVQNISSGGQLPRGLGIDPTGRWLITGNQKTDNAVAFAIDTKTGKLTPTGQSLTIGAPVDVKFVTAK